MLSFPCRCVGLLLGNAMGTVSWAYPLKIFQAILLGRGLSSTGGLGGFSPIGKSITFPNSSSSFMEGSVYFFFLLKLALFINVSHIILLMLIQNL